MAIKYVECSTIEVLGQTIGQLFIDQVKNQPHSVFILATGSSPLSVYQYLVHDYQVNKTDWSKITTFNLDEYLDLNPKYFDQSYRYFMESNLFNHININKANTHFPNVNLINEQYQQLINKHHQVDLAILGVGNNGHIAFNEPGTSLTTVTHVVDLTVSSRQANARFFNNDINNVPTQAITVGLKEILAVKKIVLIAIGDAKKQAIEHLKHAQQFDSNWPITALINHRDVTIYTVGINF